MKSRFYILFLLVLGQMILVACGNTVTPTVPAMPSATDIPPTLASTPTIRPTFTPLPTHTPTETPSATATPLPSPTETATPSPSPSPSPTPLPEIQLDARQVVAGGRFSIQPVVGFDTAVDGQNDHIFLMGNEASTIFLSIGGFPLSELEAGDTEAQFDSFLDPLAERGIVLEKGEFYSVTAGVAPGTAVDLTGTIAEDPAAGQAILVIAENDYFYFVLGVANQAEDERLWENLGLRVQTAVLESIEFLPPPPQPSPTPTGAASAGPCPISTDSSYGYTEGNPIKVGGGPFDGPPRERAYLDNLRGPNGESVTYSRAGSVPFGDTILDIYEVSIAGGSTVTLYLDEYNWIQPQAPAGFTCAAAIPLSQP